MNITIYTRRNCPLCVDGISAAVAVFGEDNVTLVDIDLDLVLMETYNERVPVVATESGEIVAEGIISGQELRGFVDRSGSVDL